MPTFPANLVDRDIRMLVGFGIHAVPNEAQRFGRSWGTQVQVTGGVAQREALVELERTVAMPRSGTEHMIAVREMFVFTEERIAGTGRLEVQMEAGRAVPSRVTGGRMRITKVHHAIVPTKAQRAACKPLEPRVVSIRLFEVDQDRSPLVLLADEASGEVILSIGNLGERIEWHPEGFRPEWFDRLEVRAQD